MRGLVLSMRAYRVEWLDSGVAAYYVAAPTAGRARVLAVTSLEECWGYTFGDALKRLRVLRAPQFDAVAATRSEPGGMADCDLEAHLAGRPGAAE